MTQTPRSTTLIALILVVGIAAVVLVLAGGDDSRRVSFVTPAALSLTKGNQVTAGGEAIGTIAALSTEDGGRAARVTLAIDDERYWPLPRDTKAELRFGGTVSLSNRYILLTPGDDPVSIPDGGELAARNVKVPEEIDSLVNRFTPAVRDDLGTLLVGGADAVSAAHKPLRRALEQAPPAVGAAADLLGDLSRDQQRLAALVTHTGRVVDQVRRADPDLRELLAGFGTTMTATASEERALRTGLDRLPSALDQTRATLVDADSTLTAADRFLGRLAPGVTELRRTATPLTSVLAQLRKVTPGARRALDEVGRSGQITAALREIASVTPLLTSTASKADKELGCIRPYTPELAMFGTTWGDFLSSVDDRDHLARAQIQNYLPANFNSHPLTAQKMVETFPGIRYGFPRPPGMLADQPWFLPECGAGPDALDPSKDKEARGAFAPAPEAARNTTRKGRGR